MGGPDPGIDSFGWDMIAAFLVDSKGLIDGPAVEKLFRAPIHRLGEQILADAALDRDPRHLGDGAHLSRPNPGFCGG